MNPDFLRKIKRDGITKEDLKTISDPVFINIAKLALKFSDGVIIGSRKLNAEIKGLVKDSKVPVLEYMPHEKYIDAYSVFYDKIIANAN